MNYEEMSDYEINKMVLVATMTDGERHDRDEKVYAIEGYNRLRLVDYCNNPSDAWPIILENKICVMHDVMAEPCDGGSWIAQPSYGYQSEMVRNDNPLRAAMIVFLMMKDAQNV